MAAVLTLHGGGADLAEIAEREDEVYAAVRAWSEVLPAGDPMRDAVDELVCCLGVRRVGRRFRRRLAASRKRQPGKEA